MKISDQIALSAKNLSRRPGRTALTVIGVIVGTCAVIVMISLGLAQSKAQDEMLQSWADLTQIEIWGSGNLNGETVELNDAALESFLEIDHVVATTPYAYAYNLQGTVEAGRNGRYQMTWLGSNLIGVYPDALEPMGFALTDGKWLPEGAVKKNADSIPVLVGEATAYNFEDTRKSQNSSKRYRWMGQTDANGNEIGPFFDIDKETMTLVISDGEANPTTKSWKLEVVGTLATDYAKGWWTQSGIVMRLKDMQMVEQAYKDLIKDRSKTSASYDDVYVKVDDVANVEAVEAALEEMGFSNTWSMASQREQMQQQVAQSQMMLGGLAAVSLLVAALNIANTMTMAIYERTREIGVMKVLGCEIGNIRTMFLIESGFIGFIGGVAGALISLGISAVLNNLSAIMAFFGQNVDLSGLMGSGMYFYDSTAKLSIIPPWLLLAALAFATVIGLVSGIAPSNRAVKISALEAIRHE